MTAEANKVLSTGSALSVNIGSSSLKYALYHFEHGLLRESPLLKGVYERLDAEGQIQALYDLTSHVRRVPSDSEAPAVHHAPSFVVHRIVHGGRRYRGAVYLTPTVLSELARFSTMAPLHQPFNLRGVAACLEVFPNIPQIGCFDTAFHTSLSDEEIRFALPERFFEQGIHRYGFHGLSYQYVLSRLRKVSERAHQKLIMAHLGNGASLCAALAGRSLATTMGFSALDGLMMGTRSGALDPGVLLYWMEQGWSVDQISQLLYRESGLLGVSGISADMRVLRASPAPMAARATDLFTRRIVRELGGLTAVLGGLDVLAFTGGIGEHDALLRKDVCSQLAYLGVKLNDQANHEVGTALSHGHPVAVHDPLTSKVEVWVIATDEGRVAAQEALGLYCESLGV